MVKKRKRSKLLDNAIRDCLYGPDYAEYVANGKLRRKASPRMRLWIDWARSRTRPERMTEMG